MKNQAYSDDYANASFSDKIDQLQGEVQRLRSQRVAPFDTMDVEGGDKKQHKSSTNQRLKSVLLWIFLICIVVIGIVLIGLNIGNKNESNDGNNDPEASGLRVAQLQQSPGKSMKAPFYNKQYINMGERSDNELQECQGPELKKSFPDLDYAFMGYNILKGYPLTIGHDPGFSLPIFTADYSNSGQTADCRYSVPRGVVVTPDVSCLLSFTSKLIQTRYEYSKTLSASTSVSGGGWGVSFSGSADYKMISSSMSVGEYAYILSSARCIYYYSRILPNMPPPLHPSFVEWVKKLDAETDDAVDLYVQFFEKYGTHFASEVTFGARYAQVHKMKSKTLDKMSESGTNVAASAKYSGIFNIGGEFNLDIGQRNAAMEFQKNVETKTITVGAPPPSTGGAQEWASSVKSDPAPVAFKLASIEELFTGYYMGGLAINYTRIATNIRQLKGAYCKHMVQKGEVVSCKDLLPGLELRNTRLFNDYKTIDADKATCVDVCDADVNCIAITKCVSCKDEFSKKRCYLFNEGKQDLKSESTDEWKSTLFIPKIHAQLVIRETNLTGISRGDSEKEKPSKPITQSDCLKRCFRDEECIAFSSSPSAKTHSCQLYAQRSITGMEKKTGTTTYFISHLLEPPAATL